MLIRKLVNDDLPALAELYTQFWGEDSSLEMMHATFQRLQSNPNYILLVAEGSEGNIVGSVMGIICEELYGACHPFMVIEDVIVDATQRRQGIGSALMRVLEQHACDRGCGYILFVTEAERTDAHRFYASLGYQLHTHQGFKKHL